MPGAEPTDEVLLAARAGAEWAWKRIYDDLAPAIAGYLRARGAPEPEDLTGEVFLQVVRGLGGFAGDGRDFRAWAFTIAHRRWVDDVRRRGRRPVAPAAPERIEAVAGAGGDVESEAHARMTDAAVRAAIEALPDDQRAVMLLRSLGDLTIEQVATALGKRVGAVKGLQRRALRRLEKAYPFDPGRR